METGRIRHRRNFSVSRLLSPFSLVIVAVALTLFGTGYWMFRTSEVSQAEATLIAAEEKGVAALNAGHIEVAKLEFAAAAAALDAIGREDGHARWIRQMHRETTAASELAADSLFEIVAQAEQWRRQQESGVRAWEDHFRLTYGETWMVFETTLWPADDGSRHRIDFPLEIGETPVRLVTGAAFLADLPENGEPREVVLAAQLKRCRLDRATRESWVVEFEPATAFLWSDLENYRAIGFEADDLHAAKKTAELLAKQTAQLGIEEPGM